MAEFKLIKDSAQAHFLNSRNQIQVMGGGFGNGKTGTICMKILDLAIKYPGSRGVFARSTKPKLEDTVKPEFFKWCPKDWIAKYPTEKHNDVILKNGSSIHFRHVRQEGKGRGENASNLLSATIMLLWIKLTILHLRTKICSILWVDYAAQRNMSAMMQLCLRLVRNG